VTPVAERVPTAVSETVAFCLDHRGALECPRPQRRALP
jgi:hypothetical protein